MKICHQELLMNTLYWFTLGVQPQNQNKLNNETLNVMQLRARSISSLFDLELEKRQSCQMSFSCLNEKSFSRATNTLLLVKMLRILPFDYRFVKLEKIQQLKFEF